MVTRMGVVGKTAKEEHDVTLVFNPHPRHGGG
jgi:hypothetical protein